MVDSSDLFRNAERARSEEPGEIAAQTIVMREPKSPPEKLHADRCAGRLGRVVTRGAQDTVRCATCDTFLYNAPRVETGRAARSVTTVHNGIKPKQRARVLLRDGGRCFLCGATCDLHVGHCVSVEQGLAAGMTETDMNDDENLVAMCAACNLGLGKEPLPIRYVIRALIVRLRFARSQT